MAEALRRRERERLRVIGEAGRWASKLPAPVAAILVGSYARGDFNLWSDVDVIMLSPAFEGLGVPERLRRVDAPPGYEVIPWTPRELEEHLARRNPLAVEAVQHGVVLRDDIGISETLARWRARLGCGGASSH